MMGSGLGSLERSQQLQRGFTKSPITRNSDSTLMRGTGKLFNKRSSVENDAADFIPSDIKWSEDIFLRKTGVNVRYRLVAHGDKWSRSLFQRGVGRLNILKLRRLCFFSDER
jgi:hypothetical protein